MLFTLLSRMRSCSNFWSCCNTLQHTAIHCNIPQYIKCVSAHTPGPTAPNFTTLQHCATLCNTLQHAATHCNTQEVHLLILLVPLLFPLFSCSLPNLFVRMYVCYNDYTRINSSWMNQFTSHVCTIEIYHRKQADACYMIIHSCICIFICRRVSIMMYIGIFIFFSHIYIHNYIYMYINIDIDLQTNMYAWIYIRVSYVYNYINSYSYSYICIYLRIYTYPRTHPPTYMYI